MNFIKTVIAVLVAQLLLGATLFFGLVLITALFTADEGVKVADGSWLELDVYGQIPTYDPPESIASSIIASTGFLPIWRRPQPTSASLA
jgi:hypothetical protein